MPSDRGLVGSVLAIVAGLCMTVGALLPWRTPDENVVPTGAPPTGVHTGYGKVALLVGLLTIVLGILMLTSRIMSVGVAGVVLTTVAAAWLFVEDWNLGIWSEYYPGLKTCLVTALGVMLGLVAVALGSPGPRRRRLALLGGTAIGCVVIGIAATTFLHSLHPTYYPVL